MTQLRGTEWQRWRDRARTAMPVLAATVLLSVLAFGTRFWGIGDKSLWLDEASSWQAANMSLSDMLDWTAGDQHPPLYYVVLHFWVDLVGNSEAALRALSAIAGAASIILLALVAWRIGGRLLGVTAAALLLLNSTHLRFSQEARMYPLMGLLSLAATVALASYITRPSLVRLAVYTFLAACLVYTHYSGVVVIAVHGLLFAGYGIERFRRSHNPSVLAGGVLAFTLIAVAYLPWLSNFFDDANEGVGHIPQPSWDLVSNVTRSALGLQEAQNMWLFLAIPLLGLGAWGIGRRWHDPLAVCLGALALVPVAMLLISVLLTPVFALRQISPFVPALAFVSAVGLVEAAAMANRFLGPVGTLAGAIRMLAGTTRVRFRASVPLGITAVLIAGVAALAVVMFLGSTNWYERRSIQEWRQVAADMQETSSPIFIWQEWLRVPLRYSLGESHRVAPLETRMTQSVQNTIPSIQHGFVPVTRERPGDEAVLILGCGPSHKEGCDAILLAFRPYFSVGNPTWYPGQLFSYRIRALASAEYNVNVFDTYMASERWTTTPEGHLRTTGSRNIFELRVPVDADGDGGVDEAFTLHLEYLDAGPPSFSLAGFDLPPETGEPPLLLANVPIEGTNSWRSVDVPVEKGSPLTGRFSLTSGVTIRTLEVRRYVLEGAEVVRASEEENQRWFLRPDGYLETTAPDSCIQLRVPADGGAGSLTMELTYLDDAKWTDMTVSVPAGESHVCPSALRAELIVRRLVVRPGP